MGDAGDAVEPLFQSLYARASARTPSPRLDLLVLFVLPSLVMIAVFLTTDPTSFEYDLADPTLWGIYASNVAHRSLRHLAGSVVGLFLVGGLEYLLLTAAGSRRAYVAVFAASLVVFPPLSHLFLQYLAEQQPVLYAYEAVGFSAPLAALTGVFPYAIGRYLRATSGFRWTYAVWPLLSAGGLAWAMGQLFGVSVVVGLLGAFGLIGVGWIAVHLHRIEMSDGVQYRAYVVSVAALVLIYGAIVYALFPGGRVGTMLGHLAGFLPGFFVPLLVVWIFEGVSGERDSRFWQ